MASRRRKHEEHENLERWLLTYADMITLLMAFFIMLYSMSQLDIKKFQAMAGSLRQELGGKALLTGGESLTRGQQGVLRTTGVGLAPRSDEKASAALQEVVMRNLRELPQKNGVEVTRQEDAVVIRVPSSELMFAAGQAELTPSMERIARQVGRVARARGCGVRVEGHTCNLPVSNGRYASNWELSTDRARNVALYLVRHSGLPPDQLAAMGYAHTRPLEANRGEPQRRRNRRVEFILRPVVAPVAAATSATSVAQPRDIRPRPINLRGQVKIPQAATE